MHQKLSKIIFIPNLCFLSSFSGCRVFSNFVISTKYKLQNLSGNHAATWQKLAADFPSLTPAILTVVLPIQPLVSYCQLKNYPIDIYCSPTIHITVKLLYSGKVHPPQSTKVFTNAAINIFFQSTHEGFVSKTFKQKVMNWHFSIPPTDHDHNASENIRTCTLESAATANLLRGIYTCDVFFSNTYATSTVIGQKYSTDIFVFATLGGTHRHLSNIDFLTVHTTYLVCFCSSVNGRSKRKRKEAQ
jgi:hypothetical protein